MRPPPTDSPPYSGSSLAESDVDGSKVGPAVVTTNGSITGIITAGDILHHLANQADD